MQAVFNPVDLETWIRKPYLDYYYQTIKVWQVLHWKWKDADPLSVFVNHAVADGYHTCKLVNDIQDIANNIKDWI